LKGSDEYLIKDLDESEFDILFLDYDDDIDLNSLKSLSSSNSNDALDIMKRRC
jgi:hypothetical protein